MARPKSYKLKGSFGDFNGTKVYYQGFGKTPGFLPATGRGFAGLKHMLEILQKKFKQFTLTFTPEDESVRRDGKLYKIRLSARAIRRFSQRRWDSSRELNLRLADQLLSETYPNYFTGGTIITSYRKGLLADILKSPTFDPRLLSVEDKEAVTKLVIENISDGRDAVDVSTAYETSKDVQLIYLKKLVAEFDNEIAKNHDEAWWQQYFSKKILYFQNNYIRRLEKMNIEVTGTRFPDFAVITSDNYLDVIEIKKPGTVLLREDTSRHNFYWGSEIAKAISQTENYIDNVTKLSDAIRSKLKDEHGFDLRIIKPRGIVIAGRASEFTGFTKRADDFRRLNEGLKNVKIVPYDELSQELKNTIISIEKLSSVSKQNELLKKKIQKKKT